MSHHGTTKDDQQISQILAQMSTTAPTTPAPAGTGQLAVHFDLDPQLAQQQPHDAALPEPEPTLAKTTTKKGGAGPGKGRGRGRAKSDERLAMKQHEWEQSRKDNHKEVERRRREAINAGINALNALLPADFDLGGESSPTSPRASSSSSAAAQHGLPAIDVNGLPIPPPGPEASTSTTAKKASTPTPGAAAAAPTSNSNKGLTLQRAVRYIQQFDAERQRLIDKWTLEKLLMEQQIRELERDRDAWRQECLRLGGGGGGGSSTYGHAGIEQGQQGQAGIAMAAAAAAAAIGNQQQQQPQQQQQHASTPYDHGLPPPPLPAPAPAASYSPPPAKRPRV